MRIVHVVRQFHPSIGGMENVVWELASAQRQKAHDVQVVTLNRVFGDDNAVTLPTRGNLDGLDVIRIPYVGSSRYPVAWSVMRHIGDADIVHVHGLDFFFDFLAWTAPIHRRHLVVSTHGGYFHTPYAARLKRLYFSTVTRLSLSRYAGVATVSEADDRLFRSIRTRGISLIENGVNIEKYRSAASREPSKVMIALGRFSSNKRLDRVIGFLAALRGQDPEWTLKIIGRPADLSVAGVVALADAAGVRDAVEVYTSPSDPKIREIIGGCSVVVSGSDYEGFGLAAVEGMSAGLFPVLSDIPPFRRLVERTGQGMIVDFSNPRSAAAEFQSCWQEVAAHFEASRSAAMAAAESYAWSRVSEQYEALYQSVLGTKVRAILDVPVGVTTVPEAVALLDDRVEDATPSTVIFANAHTLNQAMSSGPTLAALRRSIVFNDGIGVDIASRLLFGKSFPENMNGTDFVPNYLKHTRHRLRIFLLGGVPGIAERAAEHLSRVAPQHEVVGCGHGYLSAGGTADIVERIRQAQADLLLVAMGDPKQELWLTEHLAKTGCRLGIGVGALFDFMAGTVPRAPAWVQSMRLEWLYRMIQEPRRLWRRYLVGMPMFLLRVGKQWIGGARVSGAME
jgi:alpha-1,3-mannosyltransferase